MTEQKTRTTTRPCAAKVVNQIFMCIGTRLMGSPVTLLAGILLLSSAGTSHLIAAPVRLDCQVVNTTLDGMEMSYFELKGGGFTGRRNFSRNWYPDDERPAGVSISFRNRLLPHMRMQFSAYDSKELIGTLDEKGLKQYLGKQMNEYRKDRLLLKNAQAEKAAVGSLPFMGRSYWKVSYDLMDAGSQEYQYSVVDFVTVVDDEKNYRLRFTGRAESLARQSSAMKRELSLFSMER